MSDYYVEPKPGDLIEISRLGYKHWAIYVGSGYVIHLAPKAEASVNSIMSVLSKKAVVKKELLWEIARSEVCQVNNKYDGKYKPLPASQIVQKAELMLGKEVDYRVASQNCEHFVTSLRYGTARSDQPLHWSNISTLQRADAEELTRLRVGASWIVAKKVRETMATAMGLLGVGVVLGLVTVLGSLFLPHKHEEE